MIYFKSKIIESHTIIQEQKAPLARRTSTACEAAPRRQQTAHPKIRERDKPQATFSRKYTLKRRHQLLQLAVEK